MNTITSIFSWWYGLGPDRSAFPNCFFFSAIISVLVALVFFVWKSWTTTDKEELAITVLICIVISATGIVIIGIGAPLIIVCGSLYGVSYILSEWGKNYRELEKSKEQRRAEALAELLKDDPNLLKRYNTLMKETQI